MSKFSSQEPTHPDLACVGLTPPESVIKGNRLYCTCILLALFRIQGSIFERVCCLPKMKTTKGIMVISIEQYSDRSVFKFSIELQLLFDTIGVNTVAVIKNSEQCFNTFDAHSSDLHGIPHLFGKCTLLTIEGIENLLSYLQISCL